MKDLWVPISGALAQQRNVETIANNVANANTPGFKKDRMVFKEYLTALEKGAILIFRTKSGRQKIFIERMEPKKRLLKQTDLIPISNKVN